MPRQLNFSGDNTALAVDRSDDLRVRFSRGFIGKWTKSIRDGSELKYLALSENQVIYHR